MKLSDIVSLLEPALLKGNPDTEIHEARSISDAAFDHHSIGWCSDGNIALIRERSAGSVLISEVAYASLEQESVQDLNLIVVPNPRRAFSTVLQHFFVRKPAYGIIEASAYIHASVSIDRQQVSIGSNVVIEENCHIGQRVIIDHNTVIKAGTVIRDDVKIGANCTIGGVGFGYEPGEDGVYEVIPHIGNVELHANVEVGNNVCIDRAVMGSTLLHEHVKVDNLVHIAHGVVVGRNSLVIANAMVAGSVQIGENVWVAPSSSIKQKVKVGNDALIGMGSVVLKDVDAKSTVAGVPAKKIEKH